MYTCDSHCTVFLSVCRLAKRQETSWWHGHLDTWPLLLALFQNGQIISYLVIPLLILNSLKGFLWQRVIHVSQLSYHSAEQLVFLLFIRFLL